MRYRDHSGFRISPVLVLIVFNLLFFISTTISPELIYLLGLQKIGFTHRPWTIVTSMFVHGGFGHILANMITLFFFGNFLTRLLGDVKFLIVYFVGGIAGGFLFMLLASPYSIAVGASGAIFALGGALAIMRPKLRVFVFPIPAPLPLWAAALGGFFILSFFPGIAWQAHLGGIVCGLIFGYFFRKRERRLFMVY